MQQEVGVRFNSHGFQDSFFVDSSDNLFVSSIKQGNSENGGYFAQSNGEIVA